MQRLDLTTYQSLVQAIPFGKVLPTAVYIHIDGLAQLPPTLLALIGRLPTHLGIDVEGFNIIKFAKRELALSLLAYPNFDHEAHPALGCSLRIDLSSGEVQQRNYQTAANPPILHRKELLLPPQDPRVCMWAELSRAEEAAGLYQNTSIIGMRDGWQQTCRQHGLRIEDHQLMSDKPPDGGADTNDDLSQQLKRSRWRTALSRFGLSTPVQAIIRHGLINEDTEFLDYGCGLGDDCRALIQLGYMAKGWDPHFNANPNPHSADVVNLGFIINVIEDPIERSETLRHAFSLAREVLIVAVMLHRERYTEDCQPYGDGFVSRIGTFQTYFEQNELVLYLENVLGQEAVTVGPGIALVFTDSSRRHTFLARRSQRHIDFQKLSSRLFADKPRLSAFSAYDQQLRLYDEHKELIEDYWQYLTHLGRLPKADEYPRFKDLHAIGLSPLQARNLYCGMFGNEALSNAFWESHSELINDFWRTMARYGRRLKSGEFNKESELANIGLSTGKLFNHLVRQRGLDALQKAFIDYHLPLLQHCWDTMTSMGRIPRPSELPQLPALQSIGLNIKSMHQLFIDRFGQETLDEAHAMRRDDLLVYWALANFRDRVHRKDLPKSIQRDLDTFFGGYSKAMEEARNALFAAGDSQLISKLCDETPFGELDDQALYIHTSLIEELHPSLRIYIGCANILHGDIKGADIIKIHKHSGKLTLLFYDNFQRKRLPILRTRIKIWLRGQRMDIFDHGSNDLAQVLYHKERFIRSDHPHYHTWLKFSQKLTEIIGPIKGRGPSKEHLEEMLKEHGYDLQLRRIRTHG